MMLFGIALEDITEVKVKGVHYEVERGSVFVDHPRLRYWTWNEAGELKNRVVYLMDLDGVGQDPSPSEVDQLREKQARMTAP